MSDLHRQFTPLSDHAHLQALSCFLIHCKKMLKHLPVTALRSIFWLQADAVAAAVFLHARAIVDVASSAAMSMRR